MLLPYSRMRGWYIMSGDVMLSVELALKARFDWHVQIAQAVLAASAKRR